MDRQLSKSSAKSQMVFSHGGVMLSLSSESRIKL